MIRLDRIGLDVIGLERIGQDRIGLERIRLDRVGQEWTRQDWTLAMHELERIGYYASQSIAGLDWIPGSSVLATNGLDRIWLEWFIFLALVF